MENLNLPPFYPGQKVVALESAPSGIIKKGDIFTVHSCMNFGCSCGWHVFLNEFPRYSDCYYSCKHKDHHDTPKFGGGFAYRFAPLEEKFEHISLSKVIEIETCLVSEN